MIRNANTSLTEDGEALSSWETVAAIECTGISAGSKPVSAVLAYTPKWFAAYTTPRHEKAVVRQLDARHVESFLPLCRFPRRRKNGCRVTVEQPLFPGYVFVHIPDRESAKVLQAPGVLSIVSAGRHPAELPYSEIEALRLGLPHRRFEPYPYLTAGEKVRVVSGALAGLVGVLLRKKNEYRVVLALDLIRQSVAVEIDVDEIEPIKQ